MVQEKNVRVYIAQTLGITDVFKYAACEEKYFESQLGDFTPYERKTTFYSDLSIAEIYDTKSIQETVDTVLKEWMSNIEYITEFAMCLNYKAWEWSARGFEDLTELYTNLFYEVQDKIYEHYKDDEKSLHYYYSVTD